MSQARRPNIVFVMSDDHAAHAISAYGSVVNDTPSLDRLAAEGMRLDNCFCTNAICAPSRATILTGTHTHVNGVTTLYAEMDARQPSFPAMLQDAGYQTALVGKWHLGHGGIHDPVGFDYWDVLLGQGPYFDPTFRSASGERTVSGYTTDLITDLAVDWLDRRDPERPFCLLVHHKAPHRPWKPHPRHEQMFADEDLRIPPTFDDDYAGRPAAAEARMRIGRDMRETDVKVPIPDGLGEEERARWNYQRFIKDYLRCVAAVDENVGRLLDDLETRGLTDDTVVIYTSDQGFFLGDHGWYDKRFMYEESLRMPFLIRYPREIAAGSTNDDLVLNLDFAQTFLDYARVPAHPRMQGRSLRPLTAGTASDADQRTAIYYRYWEHMSAPHRVQAHYGLRTRTHKLIYYYGEALDQPGAVDEPRAPYWELFDLVADPAELRNVADEPAYAAVRAELIAELERLQTDALDKPAR